MGTLHEAYEAVTNDCEPPKATKFDIEGRLALRVVSLRAASAFSLIRTPRQVSKPTFEFRHIPAPR